MKSIRCGRTAGFTLIELMVVVAIIGILAAVAIPNYQKYQARSRQTEARVLLAAAYTAEQAFFAEHGTYTVCLRQIGFDIAAGNKRYYTVGFSHSLTNGNTACGPSLTQNCATYAFNNLGHSLTNGTCDHSAANNSYFNSTAALGGALSTGDVLTQTTIHQTVFTIEAYGYISSRPGAAAQVADRWTINQAKALNNTTNGV